MAATKFKSPNRKLPHIHLILFFYKPNQLILVVLWDFLCKPRFLFWEIPLVIRMGKITILFFGFSKHFFNFKETK